MPDRGPGLLANIAWATAAVLTIPAITAATRIKQITFEPVPTPAPAPAPRVRPVRAAGGGGGGWLPDFIFNAALFGFMFVVVDEYAGVDLLYRGFGLDILPKSQTQKTLRAHRGLWREVLASGDQDRVRDTFFRLRRERLSLAGVRYQEEPMRPPWDTGDRGPRSAVLLDPRDVRVFFILAEGVGADCKVASRICIAINADRDGPGVREKAERTTKWVLTRQAEPRLKAGMLKMPCRLETVYRAGHGGEHLLQHARGKDGSSTLADAWDCRRAVVVGEDGAESAG